VIPVTLRLRNFLCYREGVPPLDLAGRHVVCLAGPNGAGKSALLDALTWVLWGKARATSDDLISTGAEEMEVELEFELEGERYRVLRKRERGARRKSGSGVAAGRTQLDLQVRGEAEWRVLTGENVRQTEQQIGALLRMDYETFVNSAFLLQGRSDEFTVKAPGERKRILGEILGLGLYEDMERRARERTRQLEQEVQAQNAVLAGRRRELAQREEREQEVAAAEDAVEAATAALAERQEALTELREQIGALEVVERLAEEVQGAVRRLAGEVQQLAGEQQKQQAGVAAARQLLGREAQIEADHARLGTLRARNDELAALASRALALAEKRHALEQVEAAERSKLLGAVEGLAGRLADLEKTLAGRPRLEAELARQEALCTQGGDAEEAIGAIQAERQGVQGEREAVLAERRLLTTRLEELGVKEQELQGELAECPLCRRAMGPDDRAHVHHTYKEERIAAVCRLGELAAAEKDQAARLVALAEEERKQKEVLGRQRVAAQGVTRLEDQLAGLAAQAARQTELTAQHVALQARLQRGDYAVAARQALTEVQAEEAAVVYDRAEHQRVQAALAGLRDVEGEYRRLLVARETLGGAEERLAGVGEKLLERRKQHEVERQRLAKLSTQTAGLGELRKQRQEEEGAVWRAQRTLDDSRVRWGAAQRELERLAAVAADLAQGEKEQEAKKAERDLWLELGEGLGKNGVQAMLIEAAVPEIEQEANALLARLTGGEMAVHLAMQREKKAGGVSETLDIIVQSWSGTRVYEGFSGGERFRIDFALRVALSRLLARRAGTRLQTLVIDEGFGTQDAEGRERLVEVIQTVQEDFALIVVITHIEELREAFPERIVVSKGPAGSSWQAQE